MPLYLLTTQSPKAKTNWKPPNIKLQYRGNSTKDDWYFADTSIEKITKVIKLFHNINPNAIPLVKFTLRTVKTLPSRYA